MPNSEDSEDPRKWLSAIRNGSMNFITSYALQRDDRKDLRKNL